MSAMASQITEKSIIVCSFPARVEENMWQVDSPCKGPVMRICNVVFDVHENKPLNKQSSDIIRRDTKDVL